MPEPLSQDIRELIIHHNKNGAKNTETLCTNEKNIVVQAPASDIWDDNRVKKTKESVQSMFKEMSDWCMAKDYNGAERFNDGSRPLMAETEHADIIICGIPNKNEVSISVYLYDDICDYFFYEGEIATKELAVKTGTNIVNHINSNTAGQAMFISGDFKDFFKGLKIANIRTHENEETTGDSF